MLQAISSHDMIRPAPDYPTAPSEVERKGRDINLSLQQDIQGHEPREPGGPFYSLPAKPVPAFGPAADLPTASQILTSAILRAVTVEAQLAKLGSSVEPKEGLCAQFVKARTELVLERQKRKEVEQLLSDVRQEIEGPVIVPVVHEFLRRFENANA
ncbi:hypothetical protein H0H87_005068 [Tephrocybe sp. NHM501043]|nr:hypothetical protein H0H87_005068 [Tephrocybe sp. NHM501043]